MTFCGSAHAVQGDADVDDSLEGIVLCNLQKGHAGDHVYDAAVYSFPPGEPPSVEHERLVEKVTVRWAARPKGPRGSTLRDPVHPGRL